MAKSVMAFAATTGLCLGCGIGAICGIIWSSALPSDLGLAVMLAMVFGGLGLLGGIIGGAWYNLVAWFIRPGKIPTDGPEADYHEVPDKTKK